MISYRFIYAVLSIFIFGSFSCKNSSSSQIEENLRENLLENINIPEYLEPTQEIKSIEDLRIQIKLLENYKISKDKFLQTSHDFKEELSTLRNSKLLISETELSHDEMVQNLSKELKQATLTTQFTIMPVLRKKWAEVLTTRFSEDTIEVAISGTRSTTLTLTGAYFTKNKNRKDIMEQLSEILNELRFKMVIFKWYKYDDTYTTYKLNAENDNEF